MFLARYNEVIKSMFSLDFQGQSKMSGNVCELISKFSISELFESTLKIENYSQSSIRLDTEYFWSWLQRSSVQVRWNSSVKVRSLASKILKSTLKSCLCYVNNQGWERSYKCQLDLDFQDRQSKCSGSLTLKKLESTDSKIIMYAPAVFWPTKSGPVWIYFTENHIYWWIFTLL